jgi:predicted metalloprotease with PDZ domain
LQDTTSDEIINPRRPISWRDWQRFEDYYEEASLIWLEVDTLIRERSHDRKSLDDFAKAFFGVDDGSFVVRTYGFDDVVSALNAVEPYDWAGFLRARLDVAGAPAPLDGLRRGGYKLVYTEKPGEMFEAAERQGKFTDLRFSIGMSLGKDGSLRAVTWDSAAFKAGLTAGMKVLAVNGDPYDADVLKDAIGQAKAGASPIELIVKTDDRYKVIRVDYHAGLRYPHLERDPSEPARLDAILAPKA